MKTKAKANDSTTAATAEATPIKYRPQGDVNLPAAEKRYSDKSQRPAHFGRLSIACNDEP